MALASITRFTEAFESVREAFELAEGPKFFRTIHKVFIKPNIVFWTKAVAFPKWGMITTSRVVEDSVRLLKDLGINDITIGEGIVVADPKDTATAAHAFETLGYNRLKERYGVRVIDVMRRPFEKVAMGGGLSLSFNTDILGCDAVMDLPVLKTHNQTVVSLGIKNLKGTIDIASRKRCHSADPDKDLHFWVSSLADHLPPVFTIIDGIYSLERGPGIDGKVHRRDLLTASGDILAADMVGAGLLGYPPAAVPHIRQAARRRNRPPDLSDVTIVGENLADHAKTHGHDFEYYDEPDGCMPLSLARQGIRGLYYRKYDLSMCTYCSTLNGIILSAIRHAWQGEPWDRVEILTGKQMQPSEGMHKTILVGQCMYNAHRDNPKIREMIPIRGCPPDPAEIPDALQRAGIMVDPNFFSNIDELPGLFMARYAGREEFDERLFTVDPAPCGS